MFYWRTAYYATLLLRALGRIMHCTVRPSL